MVFVGDTDSGDSRAKKTRDAIVTAVAHAGASHLFLLGDNVYESGQAEHIAPKFIDVYSPVLRLGVSIHAALGNHDVRLCRGTPRRPVPRDASAYVPGRACWAADHLATPEFGYKDGARYYVVTIPSDEEPLVDAFVLDSNTLGRNQNKIVGEDSTQLTWLNAVLEESTARWKVIVMHLPVYSPPRSRFLVFKGRRADRRLRAQLEAILVKHGVDVVFQGHQHMYARLLPQMGFRYIVAGGGSRKPYAFRPSGDTYRRTDGGRFNHFVYVKATEERFEYCAVDSAGVVRDGGWFSKGDADHTPYPAEKCPAFR